MTVARKAPQQINDIIVRHLFPGQPISNIPCASVADTNAIFPQKQKQAIFTENQHKAARILNGKQATILGCENNTIILSLPEGQPVFAYPVTHMDNDQHITHYPFTPASHSSNQLAPTSSSLCNCNISFLRDSMPLHSLHNAMSIRNVNSHYYNSSYWRTLSLFS